MKKNASFCPEAEKLFQYTLPLAIIFFQCGPVATEASSSEHGEHFRHIQYLVPTLDSSEHYSMGDSEHWEDMANILFRQLKTIPRELRDQIYEYVLVAPSDIIITPAPSKTTVNNIAEGKSGYAKPPLLSVCQQIREEATPIYYAINSFRAVISDDDSWEVPFTWINKLDDIEAKVVGQLVIEFALSARTRITLDTAYKNFHEAAVQALNPVNPPGVVMAQIQQRFRMDLEQGFNRVVFRHIISELRAVKEAGRFRVSRISFEVLVSTDTRYKQVSAVWQTMLPEALKKAQGEGGGGSD